MSMTPDAIGLPDHCHCFSPSSLVQVASCVGCSCLSTQRIVPASRPTPTRTHTHFCILPTDYGYPSSHSSSPHPCFTHTTYLVRHTTAAYSMFVHDQPFPLSKTCRPRDTDIPPVALLRADPHHLGVRPSAQNALDQLELYSPLCLTEHTLKMKSLRAMTTWHHTPMRTQWTK